MVDWVGFVGGSECMLVCSAVRRVFCSRAAEMGVVYVRSNAICL